jgi:hypothetical protein
LNAARAARKSLSRADLSKGHFHSLYSCFCPVEKNPGYPGSGEVDWKAVGNVFVRSRNNPRQGPPIGALPYQTLPRLSDSLPKNYRNVFPFSVHRRQIPITKVKTKPRTNQPKKVQFVTTEVRCQEKTRGGLRYEVILSEPEVKVTPPKKAASPKNSMSVQDIEDKLKAAEERRQQLESNKIAALAAKMQKIEDASRKKDEQTSQFISATRDALEQKMENHTEKREAYITDLKTKLKDHIENVEKTRLSIEQQTDEVRSAIEEKLKTASVQRDENIKKMLERLKEHVSNQCRFVIGALLNIIINTFHSQMLACLCASSRKNKCKRSEPAMLLNSNN